MSSVPSPCGATLVTGRKELVLGDIGKAIKSLRINVVHCTPSILAVVPLENYPTLETVVVAGEALGKKLIEDWSKRVKFMNMYGPTEASVDCIHTHVTDASLTGVIGRPLPNNRSVHPR
jgi:non-ribosomal peptide synthetase component F